MQRLMFVTYVNTEDQRRDEGHRCAVYLAHRTEALALRTAEEEDRWQLLARLHYVRRQGLQWERYPGCRGMLEGWRAERLRRKLQAQEQQARHTLEREACLRQETYGRYNLARQWCRNQRQLQGIAQGLAQMAGLVSLECEWRDRLAQEESQHMVAQGGSFVQTAEAAGRRGLQGAAIGCLDLLHAFVRDKQLILQHSTAQANMIAQARHHAGRAIPVRAMRHVLRVEAQGRARVASYAATPHHPTQGIGPG